MLAARSGQLAARPHLPPFRLRSFHLLVCTTLAIVYVLPIGAQEIHEVAGDSGTTVIRMAPEQADREQMTIASSAEDRVLTTVSAARSGISPLRMRGSDELDVITSDSVSDRGNHVKRAVAGAAIGAAAGAAVGAIIGSHINRTRPGTISATPIIAVEGGLVGLLVGMAIGAFIP